MTRPVDVAVLGTGPSGQTVARRCAEAGRRVVVVESREVGGTCALRGCNPKKVLVEAAALVDRVRRSHGQLVRDSGVSIDWPSLVDFERTFTDDVPERARGELEEAGVDVVVGAPRFTSPGSLEVEGERIEAERIVVATGARPRTLDVDGAEHVVTSDEFLRLEHLPPRVLFVGAGYVSFEFAHIAARAGAHAILQDVAERPLPTFDADLVDALVERTRALGVDVRLGHGVRGVERSDDGYVVTSDDGSRAHVDLVVHGAGRVPSLDGLDLGAGDVACDDDGVLVDRHLRSTSNPRVFALGDCAASGHPKLTPVANAHAHAVARMLVDGGDHVPDVEATASVVFTVPPLASVGVATETAEDDDALVVVDVDWSRYGSVRKVCGGAARAKLVTERAGGRVVGAHLLGPRADEVVNLFVLAIRARLTAADLKAAPLAFPTSGHDVRSMV